MSIDQGQQELVSFQKQRPPGNAVPTSVHNLSLKALKDLGQHGNSKN